MGPAVHDGGHDGDTGDEATEHGAEAVAADRGSASGHVGCVESREQVVLGPTRCAAELAVLEHELLGAEEAPGELVGGVEEEALRTDLAAVGQQRRTLVRQDPADVDDGGDLLVGGAHRHVVDGGQLRVPERRRQAGRRQGGVDAPQPALGQGVDVALAYLPRLAGHVGVGVGGQRHGTDGDAVGLDVVGVAVAAVLVVGHDDVGPDTPDDTGQARRRLVEVGHVEAVGVLVVGGAGHAAVAVAEPDVLVDGERGDRGRHLTAPVGGQVLVAEVDAGQVLARLPAGAGHHHGAPATRGRTGEHAPTGDRFVVGVGVHAQQGGTVLHGASWWGVRRVTHVPTVASAVSRTSGPCAMPEQPASHPDPSTAGTVGDVVFVDDRARVPGALATVAAPVVGVDVERADADRYFRRAALVQVGTSDRCLLIDAVALPELAELDGFLDAGRTAVLHALENDLDPLARMGVTPDAIADTGIAAAVLGLPIGLSALLAEVLEVQLTADKEAYQRADWAARPLSPGMADYAAGDVFHLPTLWQELADRLDAAGRRTWYEQELAWTVQRAGEDNRDWTRVKGAGRLDPAAKAVLRSLWEEREHIAREHDIAPNRLVHDEVLRDLAEHPVASPDELVRRSQRRRGLLREHAPDLFAALQRGQDAPPEAREEGARRWSTEDKAAYDALRRARAGVAADLGIEPGVLCSSRPLWRAVAGRPEDPLTLCALADLRPWQTDLLHEVLWEAYTAALTPTG